MAVEKHQFDDEHREWLDDELATLGLSPQLRKRIRMAARENGQSVKEYLRGILEQNVPEEKNITKEQKGQSVTDDIIEQLRLLSEQIAQESQGKPFEDSTELIHKMREERIEYLANLHNITEE